MAKKSKKSRKAKDTAATSFEPYRVWLAGLGAYAKAEQGEPELLEDLVELGRDVVARRGLKVKTKARQLRDDVQEWLQSTRSEIGKRVDQQVSDALQRVGVPSNETLSRLEKKLDELHSRVADVEKPDAAAGPVEVTVAPATEGWSVQAAGESKTAHSTKKAAVTAARALDKDRAPSVLVIQRQDGTEQERSSYDAD